MSDKQYQPSADVNESDNCCSKCRKDLSGCIAILKILLGPKTKGQSGCDKNVTQSSKKISDTCGDESVDLSGVSRKNPSREVPEGREQQSKNIGIETEETEANFDVNSWLNMNRTEVMPCQFYTSMEGWL